MNLNAIFKLFEQAPENKPSRPLRIQTVYGASSATSASSNLWHAHADRSVLTRQKEILSRQSRYSSIEEVVLDKNALLIGFEDPAEFSIKFSIHIYYSSKEWEGLERYAASRKMGIACYQPKHDNIPCLKLIKPGNSNVCSYLVESKAIEISPTRGWLVLPKDSEAVCTENSRNRLKN